MATDRLSLVFGALADPTRRAILTRLAEGEATVAELAAPFAVSQPAVSKHLGVLKAAVPLALSADVEHFYAHLHQVLDEIDFEDRTGHLMERLRRLFNRAQLDRNELNIMRGILSAVQGRRGQSTQRSRK